MNQYINALEEKKSQISGLLGSGKEGEDKGGGGGEGGGGGGGGGGGEGGGGGGGGEEGGDTKGEGKQKEEEDFEDSGWIYEGGELIFVIPWEDEDESGVGEGLSEQVEERTEKEEVVEEAEGVEEQGSPKASQRSKGQNTTQHNTMSSNEMKRACEEGNLKVVMELLSSHPESVNFSDRVWNLFFLFHHLLPHLILFCFDRINEALYISPV